MRNDSFNPSAFSAHAALGIGAMAFVVADGMRAGAQRAADDAATEWTAQQWLNAVEYLQMRVNAGVDEIAALRAQVGAQTLRILDLQARLELAEIRRIA